MSVQNTSKEEQQQYKKKKEWNAIKNCIPLINECLQLNIDPETYDDKYSRESPDFVFSNNDKSIGVEVVECYPSVRKCKTKNAVEQESFEKKICNEFKKNKYLETITETEKLNIIIYRKYPKKKKRGTVQEVCHELEDLLRSWYQKTNPQSERNYISYIRVSKTTCCNVIYFNSASRCIPVNWDDINLKSATKLFSVLLASKRPLITELADKLRLKYPLLPTISPCPTMRLEAIRSIIPISCRRYPKSV